MGGGGIRPAYEAVLSFNGRFYPTNPTNPPARPAEGGTEGTVLISREDEGQPLFH